VNGFAEYIPKYSLALLPWLSTWPEYGEEYLDDGFGARQTRSSLGRAACGNGEDPPGSDDFRC